MKITNNGITSTPLTLKPAIQDPQPIGSDTSADNVQADSNAYTPSPEWSRLLDQVKSQPEIRSDRVQAALDRLNQGYFTTAESAAKTADAMLGFPNT